MKLADGSERDVLDVLTHVMNFWQAYLYSFGAIPNSRVYTVPNLSEPRSRSDCKDSTIDFEMVRGLRFKQTFRLQKYNYVTCKIEPVDLTGSQVKFSIYPRVPLSIDLVLENNATGQEFTKTVTLSEVESEEIAKLKTDVEKQSYIDSLPIVQEAIRELATEAGILRSEP